MTMFDLLPRTDVPVLVDFPETIEEQGSEPSSCPMPPRHNPDLNAAIDEANSLRNAYDRNLEATGGRTMLGRVADVDGVVGLIEKIIEIEGGALDRRRRLGFPRRPSPPARTSGRTTKKLASSSRTTRVHANSKPGSFTRPRQAS